MAVSTSEHKPALLEFQTFNDKKLEMARDLAKVFCQDILRACFSPGWTLSLMGRPDVGKSFLAQCMLNELGRDAKMGVCTKVASRMVGNTYRECDYMVRDWRNITKRMYGGEFNITDQMIKPRVLVIDDVNAGYDPNGMAICELDRIIRARVDKWTVITFNTNFLHLRNVMEQRVASFINRGRNVIGDMDTKEFALR